MRPDSVIELLANPKRASRLAERERAARRGAPGWLGITARDNSQAVLFGDGDVEMNVHERSAAYSKSHLRTGYVLIGGKISVEGHKVSLEDFEKERFPVGTDVGIEFYDPNSTGRRGRPCATVFKLPKWPRTRPWERQPRVACGARVLKKDRRKFLAEMIAQGTKRGYLQEMISGPRTNAPGERRLAWCLAYSYLSFLVLVRDNDKTAGVWGRHIDMANTLGISIRTINDLTQMLYWFGLLRRKSYPTRERDSNLYEITWPMRSLAAAQPKPVPEPPTAAVRLLEFGAGEPATTVRPRRLRFDGEKA